jgi:hypothetical protein
MNYLDVPCYRKEENVFILYKANFTTNEPGFSEYTSVAGGNTLEVGRFDTLEELQKKSLELFRQNAEKISD